MPFRRLSLVRSAPAARQTDATYDDEAYIAGVHRDDRRTNHGDDAIQRDELYRGLQNFPMKLVGPRGAFIWTQLVDLPQNEAELDAFIRKGLGLPSEAAPAAR
jgi:hypothetical protein